MKTSIFVPITIVVLCLAALGVLVWQAIAPPPIVANNQVVVTPPAQVAPTPMPATTTEPRAVAPEQQVPTSTSIDVGAGKDSGLGATAANFVDPACKTDGCSGQLCEDAKAPSLMTTCEMKPEYACYHQKGARCEVQKTGTSAGHCGWSQTPELAMCIGSSKGTSAQ